MTKKHGCWKMYIHLQIYNSYKFMSGILLGNKGITFKTQYKQIFNQLYCGWDGH